MVGANHGGVAGDAMTTIAAIIVGIDGWQEYTLPLVESIRKHSACRIVVIDNASTEPYPALPDAPMLQVCRTERLSYSAAINYGKRIIDGWHGTPDWYIVLSNDVLCTSPFAHLLEPLPPCVAGPQLWHEHGLRWIVGWAVCIKREVWEAVNGWDEQFIMSSWEDVDISTSALEKGYPLAHMPELPFVHLDQKQRFGLPGYAGSESHNYHYFAAKHNKAYA